jgi:O-antigen/teichoic acid export membrane protein
MSREGSPPQDVGDSIARNTAFTFAAQAASVAFTAVLTIFLVRRLGPYEFGLFSLALAIGGLLLVPADFGISPSTSRFLAEARNRPADAAKLLAGGIRLKLMTAGAFSVLLFACAGPIANAYEAPGLAWPVRAMAIAMFAQGLLGLFGYSFIALRQAGLNLRAFTVEGATETFASIGLVLLGGAATAAAFGRAIGYVVGALLCAYFATRLLGRSAILPRGQRDETLGRIGRYAGPLFLVDSAFTALGQIDTLLIGAIRNAAAAGIFQAPWRLADALHYPGFAVSAGVAPRLARGEGQRPDASALAEGIRILLPVQVLFATVLLVWATPLTDLFLGTKFAESAGVLRALSPYVLLAGLAPIASISVNYLGEARRRIPIAAATLVANTVVDLILIPKIGPIGGAVGSTAGYLIYVPGHLWICDRLVGLPRASLVWSLLRSLAAGAAMAVVLYAVGTGDLSAAQWVYGTLGGLAAFGAVLYVTGELTQDLAALRSMRGR